MTTDLLMNAIPIILILGFCVAVIGYTVWTDLRRRAPDERMPTREEKLQKQAQEDIQSQGGSGGGAVL